MLVKSDNKEEALDDVKEFLERYGEGNVRDRYQV
jgi:hypothetical protein